VAAATGAVVTGAPPHYELALWHGLNLPFLLGVLALAGGLLVAVLRRPLASTPARLPRAEHLYECLYNGLVVGTGALFARLHDRSLQKYLAILLATIVLAGFLASPGAAFGSALQPVTWLAVVGWAILVAAAGATVWRHTDRLSAVVLISVVGLLIVLTYAHLSAPDLALTQIAVEIVTTVLLLLAIRILPPVPARPRPRLARRLRNGMLALGAGAGAGVLAFASMTRPREAIVARDVLAQATEAHGRNLVHLILVDFRAFDTLGEISVLMIAALGVFALIRGLLQWLGGRQPLRRMVHPAQAREPHPLLFVIIARLLLPLALLVAAFLFLRGATHPGGGFVAGLVVAMAVLIQYMAHGVEWTERRILIGYRKSVALGVLVPC
jgi:multicomponent K+:H+ antiporter subunit A